MNTESESHLPPAFNKLGGQISGSYLLIRVATSGCKIMVANTATNPPIYDHLYRLPVN